MANYAVVLREREVIVVEVGVRSLRRQIPRHDVGNALVADAQT